MIDTFGPSRKARNPCYGVRCHSAFVGGGVVGATTVDEYVLDALMRDLVGHDRQPSAFVVYLSLWRCTKGDERQTTQVALQDLAEATGLSKRSVQDAVAWLS